jgi:alpha-1,6-mannosyltransferase
MPLPIGREPARRASVPTPKDRMTARPHLVDTTLFFSPTSGGVRRYLLAKHAWLHARTTVEHTLLVPGPSDRGHRGSLVQLASPRIPWGGGYRLPWRLGEFAARLRSLAPDLVEAADPYQVGWIAARVAERLRVPSVAFCHSDLVALLGGRVGSGAARAAGRYLRTLYSRYDLVLAPSRIVVERLRDVGVQHATAQPLGVDVGTFAPARADPALRSSLCLPRGTRLLVFAGRLAPEKNLDELYATVRLLGAPYHLLVIGGAERSRPHPRVDVVPYERDPRRLAGWLATADAHVHAGRVETFGLVTLEAMACGLPVVAYEAGALPEIVDPSVGVLAPPHGARALAAAVVALFERPQAPMRAAARDRVVREFTWDQTLSRQLRHYAALLQRGSLLRQDALPSPA